MSEIVEFFIESQLDVLIADCETVRCNMSEGMRNHEMTDFAIRTMAAEQEKAIRKRNMFGEYKSQIQKSFEHFESELIDSLWWAACNGGFSEDEKEVALAVKRILGAAKRKMQS